MIFVTVVLTSLTRYSGGVDQAVLFASTARTQRNTSFEDTPERMLLPHSRVSGRSVTSRIVTLATRKIQHSSCTVPESDKTQKALLSSAMKSKSPNGS